MSNPSSIPDKAAGAEQARWFAEEVRPHEPALRAYLRRRFPSLRDTDDLVQESYLRLFRARAAGRIACAKAYLFGIARNAALTIFRRARTKPELIVADFDPLRLPEPLVDITTAVNTHQELALALDAIDRLPARCRQVLILWSLQGLSPDEIAAELAISPHTVRAQLAKGLKRCTEFMKERGVTAPSS
ncbi:MAG: RNA polymerase sigma factor [Opitutaceae bacterium]|nr:RNA polymerase sigma factor [Opitutaceae bacterium]